MAKYVSVNDDERYYPELGLVVKPNEEVELPDGVSAVGLQLVEKVAKPTLKKLDSEEGVSE